MLSNEAAEVTDLILLQQKFLCDATELEREYELLVKLESAAQHDGAAPQGLERLRDERRRVHSQLLNYLQRLDAVEIRMRLALKRLEEVSPSRRR